MFDPSGGQGVPPAGGSGQVDALLRDAREFALVATRYDGMQQYKTALFYYVEAIQAMYNAALANPDLDLSGKYSEYVQRVRSLQAYLKKGDVGASAAPPPSKTEDQIKLERANFLLKQALDEDEEGNHQEAIELYLNAAELCIKGGKSSAEPQKSKLNGLAKSALDRAESLKLKNAPAPSLPDPPANLPVVDDPPMPDLPLPPSGPLPSFDDDGEDDDQPTSSNHSSRQSNASSRVQHEGPPTLDSSSKGGGGGGSGGGGGGGKYTAEEIQVLRRTSCINGREYVPFISAADLKEKFAYPVPFTDKCGKLVLAPKQTQHFGRWARPEEFCHDPKIILTISSFSVKQTIIQDCSFLSSLAIAANYERRWKKILISNIIYPQDKKQRPVYNPCGKYMVIFRINGVKRKVIIDDYLPLDKNGQLLCSFSSNRNELWVSLLEKAYMKVMGGYDFPGSNSNIDLYTLTGWIPERINMKSDKDFDPDKTFRMLQERFKTGHVLVTVATGPMSDADADRAGLVSTHAYALLDIREIQGKKLMQLKNPWSHLRWKGNFSEFDKENWTPHLQKECNFDPQNAQQFDNGVFWIDYQSVVQFFDVLYLNWDPGLFPRTYVLHSTWTANEGPKKDVITMGNNPQYRLEVKGKGAVWILLSRHITDKADFAENKEFITLVIFKGGKKVFYPNDPPPYMDGTRINSPHYLCKLIVSDPGSLYTVIVSQFEKSNTIHYSLRVHSTCDFKFSKMPEPYKHTKSITGEWKGMTAGGCANHRATFTNNPIYQVNLQETAKGNYLMVDLKGPRDFYVGFEMVAVTPEGVGESFDAKRSGDYRRGFSLLQLENLKGGIYNIRPTTFEPGQESPFFLTISASCPLKVAQLQ